MTLPRISTAAFQPALRKTVHNPSETPFYAFFRTLFQQPILAESS